MSQNKERIFLGTVLLERNRWGKIDSNRTPTYLVSDWTQRIADDGFDGVELWDNHALLADQAERERLRTGPAPVALYNSYAGCENEDLAARKATAEMANYFGAEGMKFNFGKDPEHQDLYIENIKAWAEMFAPEYRMLSENHRGTITADAAVAANCYEQLGDNVGGIIHFNNDRDSYEDRFGAYGAKLTHIHCMLSNEEGPMAEDDVRDRVAWLREFGFSGTYTIEFTEGVRGEATIEELYRNAVRDLNVLRKCLAAE